MPTKTIVYDASNTTSPDIKRLLKEEDSARELAKFSLTKLDDTHVED